MPDNDIVAALTAELAARPTGDCVLIIGTVTDTIPTAQLAKAFGVVPAPAPAPVAYYDFTTTVLNVRATPNGALIGQYAQAEQVGVLPDTAVTANGLIWLKTRGVNSLAKSPNLGDVITGWCAQNYLEKTAPVVVQPVPIPPKPKPRIGLHVFADGSAAAETFINEVLPPSVTGIDDEKFINWCAGKGVRFPIYRSVQVANGDDVHIPEDDPGLSFAAGRQVVIDRWSRFSGLDKRVYIQITNEQAWNPGHNAFWLGVMAECEARGYHAAIGAYSVGTPEPAQWVQLTEALTHAKANGHVVVLHCYNSPGTPYGQLSAVKDQPFYEGRPERLYAAVSVEARPFLIISEYAGEFSRGKFQGIENTVKVAQLYERFNATFAELVSINLWTVGVENWADASINSAIPSLIMSLKN